MQHSRSPSRIDALRAAAIAAAGAAIGLAGAGCGDDCGFGGAPETGLLVAGNGISLDYGTLTSLIGNDCPAPGAPDGVISLSIEGHQVGNEAQRLTFCIPRPDLLLEGPRSLGSTTSTAEVRIIDATGADATCTYKIDRSQEPTGSLEATGVCSNGDAPDGFAISLDGGFLLERTCATTIDVVPVTLRGRVRVTRRPT